MKPETFRQLSSALSDDEVVDRVTGGDTALFEILIRRHNERIYRTCRAILGNEDEARDVMQETYVRAFRALAGFEGRARFSTWLTRIAVNESLARMRARRKLVTFQELFADPRRDEPGSRDMPSREMAARLTASSGIENATSESLAPDNQAAQAEMARILSQAIDSLPEELRLVVVLRDVQNLSTRETAEAMGQSEANVKVRLRRARRELRKVLERKLGSEIRSVYSFHLSHCDWIVERVFERISSI